VRHLILAFAISLAAGSAFAADVTSAWVRQLSLDGYEEIRISRTWLGRTRIVAERGEIEREIILNTRTGEVLRDYSRHEDGSLRLPLGFDVQLGEDDSENEHDAEDREDDGGEDDEGDDDEGDDDDGDDDDGEDGGGDDDGGEDDGGKDD